MRILFMGTPEFALGSLSAIVDAGYMVAAVVTQPDKPKGRGHKMLPPPVKEYAALKGIAVYQPETLKNQAFLDTLKQIDPELIVVAAYGKILPEYILNYPRYGCINVHASLLPQYRGAAPIQRSIIDGNTKSGITIMKMEKGLDTGDMLLKGEVLIDEDDTAATLHDKLSKCSMPLIVEAIKGLEQGRLIPEKQDDSKATYANMIHKSDALIDWNKDAKSIRNLIRGMNSWPLAYTIYKGLIMKVSNASITDEKSDFEPGTVIGYFKGEGLKVSCGNNEVLLINEVQFEGKRRMSVDEYIQGHTIDKGVLLGV